MYGCERLYTRSHAFLTTYFHLPLLTMSYNREWDQGKEWDDRDYRVHTRGREDDEYYNDGKRRKYNNGVRI